MAEFSNTIYSSKSEFVLICGDVNVNFMSSVKDNNCKILANLFSEYNIKPTIFISTRITKSNETFIENIFKDFHNFDTIIVAIEMSDQVIFKILRPY